MNSSLIINFIVIIVLIVIFYYIYQKQQKSYNKELKSIKLQNIKSLETANAIHIKHLNESIEQLEASTEERLEVQKQKYQENLNEKDDYINSLYEISMTQSEILTYQVLTEIKQQFITENLIYEPEMIIMNNVFIPYVENQQTLIKQIDHLILHPVGLFIIETKKLKNTIVHGLTKEELGEQEILFDAIFPDVNAQVEQTFMIEPQENTSYANREIKIIKEVSPVLEVNKTTEILTRYLNVKTTFNQVIKPIVYYSNSETETNKLINYSELKEVPLFTNPSEMTHYFRDQITNREHVLEIEEMYEIKSIIEEFSNKKELNIT